MPFLVGLSQAFLLIALKLHLNPSIQNGRPVAGSRRQWLILIRQATRYQYVWI